MKFREKLLSLLVRWLGLVTPVEAVNAEGEKVKSFKISSMLLANLGASGKSKPVSSFKMPVLPKGVNPNPQLAMDDGGMIGFANTAGVSMGFLGYPVLSELSQCSEYRAPVQTLATEMTRKWIQFKCVGEGDLSEQIKKIEVAFDHFKVRDAFKLATEHDGFFGRGNLFIDIDGDADRDLPLVVDKATIKKGSLKQLKVIESIWTTPVQYNSIDPTDKYFYKPNMWYVMGKPVHSTRFLTFVSHQVADMLKPSYNFSGLSMTQMMMPYVDNWLRTRDSVSDLTHSFSTSGIKTNLDILSSGGSDATDLINRAELFNRMRDNRGLMMMDKDSEEFFQFNTPLSGLDKLQAQAQEQMAAPCHIPLVKLFGITPSGLNASSEEEIKVYYDYVASQQQAVYTDHLVTILKIIQLHLFGQIYDEITFEFVPLAQMTEEQISNINKTKAETGSTLIESGVLSVEEERTRLADDSFSGYNSLDVENLPERDDSDPAMDANGDWDESKHSRADNGQFGNGSSSAKNSLTGGFAPIHQMAASGGGSNPTQHKGKADLSEIFQVATSRTDGNRSFANISHISGSMAQKVEQETGVDVSGWVHGIDEAAIRHILRKHGDSAKEAKRGQIAVTQQDIENLGNILNSPDTVKYGGINDRGNEVVELEKEIGDKVFVIHEMRAGQQKMSVTSMWIKQKKKTP